MPDPATQNPLTVYFADVDEMLAEADHLKKIYEAEEQDEIAISNFYNGKDTMTDCEADRRNANSIVNHLLGYNSINTAKAQLESVLNNAPEFVKIKMTSGIDSASERAVTAAKATKIINCAIRRSRRLKPHWGANAGDIVLHGRGVFTWNSRWDWLPQYSRPMVPPGTRRMPSDIPYAIIPTHISLADVERYLKTSERDSSPWNRAALLQAKEDILSHSPAPGTSAGTALQSPSPFEETMAKQGASDTSESWRLRLPVYYVYTARPDGEKTSFDLTIVARYSPQQTKRLTERGVKEESQLFHREKFVDRAEEWISPFFLDAYIGGEPTWHRTMGLGRLNYDSDVETEEFFNEAMTGSREQLRRLWRITDAGDAEEIGRWASGEEDSNVIPVGLEMVESPKNGNFPAAFTIIEMLRQATQVNSQSSVSNANGERTANELEVQALQRQSQNAVVMGNRMADLYESADALAAEIVRRFLQPVPPRSDPGYADIKYVHDEFEKEGIPRDILRQRKDGHFTNIKVTVNRVVGDGDRVKEIMANRALEARLHLFEPESRQRILRHLTASDSGDYDLAEELVPIAEEKPEGRAEQVERAHSENSQMESLAGTGYISELREGDVHPTHAAAHGMSLQADIQQHQVRPWDQIKAAAFDAKFKHATAHIQAMPDGDEKNQFIQGLQQLAAQGDQILKQLQAQQQQQQQQDDPEKVAKAMVAAETLALKNRQQEALQFERDRRFELDTRKAAVTESANNERLNLDARRQEHESQRDVAKALQEAAELQQQPTRPMTGDALKKYLTSDQELLRQWHSNLDHVLEFIVADQQAFAAENGENYEESGRYVAYCARLSKKLSNLVPPLPSGDTATRTRKHPTLKSKLTQ